ncbi:restriction endonuclease subunit S [Aedoeadaptatus pacaensis]|uniref:restriction endonuclease subunit S n=1 Tax=Aedoeadaptatus pacaensis TaxID=1776390 RepID=UPI000837AA87|nr:restriction endonuclease subunit S [Peptoniphilus pacaensis]
MTEWMECKISDIGTVVGGATPSTKRPENYDGGTIAWITPKDLSTFRGRYIERGERNITQKGLKSCSTQLLPENTVLFSSRAPIGYVAIAANEVCTNQGFKSVMPNENIDPIFLYYLLKYNKEKIEAMGSGTTFKEVSGNTMKNIIVSIPKDKKTQEKIALVLGSLDDKIEKNESINNNLEEQAMAIFKSWFIDFEPYNGNIPPDWKEYKLSEFLPVITGKKNANVSSSSGLYPFFSCSQDISWTDDYSFEGSAILVAGNGDFNAKFYNGKFEAYQRTYVLIPHNEKYSAWLYYAIKHNLNKITLAARGSVIKFITKGNLENFSFYAPRDLEDFHIIDYFNAVNNHIASIREENIRLSELRDALLPKLMSGEINVSDIEV